MAILPKLRKYLGEKLCFMKAQNEKNYWLRLDLVSTLPAPPRQHEENRALLGAS